MWNVRRWAIVHFDMSGLAWSSSARSSDGDSASDSWTSTDAGSSASRSGADGSGGARGVEGARRVLPEAALPEAAAIDFAVALAFRAPVIAVANRENTGAKPGIASGCISAFEPAIDQMHDE